MFVKVRINTVSDHNTIVTVEDKLFSYGLVTGHQVVRKKGPNRLREDYFLEFLRDLHYSLAYDTKS